MKKTVRIASYLLSLIILLTTADTVLAGHTHSESCYQTTYHTHDDSCYDITYHEHTDSCHTITYHVHDASCYKTESFTYEEQCPGWAYGGWEYNGQWWRSCSTCDWDFCVGSSNPGAGASKCPHTYTRTGTRQVLICGKTEETIESDEITCGKTEQTEESRTLICGKDENTVESRTLICGQTESVDPPAPAPVSTPTPTPETSQEPVKSEPSDPVKPTYTFKDLDKIMYATEDVKVRDLPASEGKKISDLKKDDEVHITGQCKENGWYRFEVNGKIGYADSKYFTDVKSVINEEKTVSSNVPAEPLEEIKVSVDASNFDFELYYKFVEEGLEVVIVPSNVLILAEDPYSFDNKVTWTAETTTLLNSTGTYYISVKNINGDIKTKILNIDLAAQTVVINDDDTALASSKSSVQKFPFKVIGFIFLILVAIALAFYVVVIMQSGKATVIDSTSGNKVGTVKFKKKGSAFEAIINDKILINLNAGLSIIPSSQIIKKYIGYSLNVKSSQGIVDTEISDKIDVDF